jgi:hypothetical protein
MFSELPDVIIAIYFVVQPIYIDSDLDKEFAKAAIDAEVTYSNLAEDVFRSHLQTLKKKRGS